MNEIRSIIVERAKQLRIKNRFTVSHVAGFLNMSEEEYLLFEAGETDVENDYFVLSMLTYLYGVSLDYIFGKEDESRKSSGYVRDGKYDFGYWIADKRGEFIEAVKNIKKISSDKYEELEKNASASMFKYTDENGDGAAVVIADGYGGEEGYSLL